MAPPPTPAPAAAPAADAGSPIVFDGLFDGYYMYNFTGANSITSPVGSPAVRAYDLNSNAFTVGYAKVGMGIKASETFSLRLDMGYGAVGQITNSFANVDPGAPNPPVATLYSATGFFVEQAYATGNFGPITLDFGKFDTWAGAEVIQNNLNWNYSRSILFSYIPALHTGARAALKLNDMVTVKAAVVNAWNDLGFEGSFGPAKTIGANVSLAIPSGPGVSLTGYFGKNGPQGDTGNWRNALDLVVTYAQDTGGFKNGLNLYLNFDYIKQTGDAVYNDGFWGIAAAGRLQLHEHFALAARGEFAQLRGVAADPTISANTSLYEGTLTAALPFSGHYEIRLEGRADGSNQRAFNGGADKGQFTGTIGVLAWF